jgi:hypothetical protein
MRRDAEALVHGQMPGRNQRSLNREQCNPT